MLYAGARIGQILYCQSHIGPMLYHKTYLGPMLWKEALRVVTALSKHCDDLPRETMIVTGWCKDLRAPVNAVRLCPPLALLCKRTTAAKSAKHAEKTHGL